MTLPYNIGLKLSKKFIKLNPELNLVPVGSLARKEKMINDLDFITVEDLPNKKKYWTSEINGVPVDVWKVQNKSIGIFIRTIDKGHLIALHKILKKKGYKLDHNGILNLKTNELLPFSISKLNEITNQ